MPLGFSYERSAIENYLLHHDVSPNTSNPLTSKVLLPNEALVTAICKVKVAGGSVVPKEAYEDAKIAARPKTEKEVQNEHLKVPRKDKLVRGFSRNAIKNLIGNLPKPGTEGDKRKHLSENFFRRVRKFKVEDIKGDGRILTELSYSGIYETKTFLDKPTTSCLILGGTSKRDPHFRGMGQMGAFKGMHEAASQVEHIKKKRQISGGTTVAGSKILCMASPKNFPDILVTAGQEKCIRVWKWAISDEVEASEDLRRNTLITQRKRSIFGKMINRNRVVVDGNFNTGSNNKENKENAKANSDFIHENSNNERGDDEVGAWLLSTEIFGSEVNDWVNCVKASADGSAIFCGCRNGSLKVLNSLPSASSPRSPLSSSWICTSTVVGKGGDAIKCMDLGYQDRLIVEGGASNVVRVWDCVNSSSISLPVTLLGSECVSSNGGGHRYGVSSVKCSGARHGFGGDNLIATAGTKGECMIWDIRCRCNRPAQYSAEETDFKNCGLELSNCGNWIATIDEGCMMKILDARNLKSTTILSSHEGCLGEGGRRAKCVGMTTYDDGRNIAICNSDGVIRSWETKIVSHTLLGVGSSSSFPLNSSAFGTAFGEKKACSDINVSFIGVCRISSYKTRQKA